MGTIAVIGAIGAAASAIGMLTRSSKDAQGNVLSVRFLGIPLFHRVNGQAHVLGFRAKRMDIKP